MDEQPFRIRNLSPDLFQEFLRTVPISPPYADLEFIAEGIKKPQYFEEEKYRAAFIESCRAKGVIPFSSILFEPGERGFVPSTSFDEVFRLAHDSLGDLVKGGKIHTLRFKTSSQGDFELFMHEYFGKITREGYELSDAALSLTTYRLTGYNEGIYPGTQLFLENSNKVRISFGAEDNCDKAESERKESLLKNWFKQLSKKAG